MATKKAAGREKGVSVFLKKEDLDTLVLVLLLHQNARMKAAAEVPGMSSRELNAFGKEQERLKKLRELLKVTRTYLED